MEAGVEFNFQSRHGVTPLTNKGALVISGKMVYFLPRLPVPLDPSENCAVAICEKTPFAIIPGAAWFKIIAKPWVLSLIVP